ncbi:MAG: hypothetical protein Kow00114_36050 [Kiloniellaceae bacterium]
MTVFVHNDVLDNGPQYIKTHADRIIACDGAPATYAAATTPPGSGGNALADAAVSSGDFTLAAGATDGRKLSWPDKTGVPIDDGGGGDHAAIVDDTNSKLLLVFPATVEVSLTSGGPTLTIKGKSYTVRAPSVV